MRRRVGAPSWPCSITTPRSFFFYALIAPALPWILARKKDLSAVWAATIVALLLLLLFSALLWPACAAANCGQGAILVALLWGVAGFSAMITLMVAGLMTYFRR